MKNKLSNSKRTKQKIKNKYTYKDLNSPDYSPSYDQDARENLYEYVIKTMDDEF